MFEATGQSVFEFPPFLIPAPPDPLEIVGVPLRFSDCLFPYPGLYQIQF